MRLRVSRKNLRRLGSLLCLAQLRGEMNILEGVQEVVSKSSLVPIQANEVRKDAWLVEFGFDSVNSAELVMSLEEHFDLDLPDREAASVQTISDIVTLIEEQVV